MVRTHFVTASMLTDTDNKGPRLSLKQGMQLWGEIQKSGVVSSIEVSAAS